MGKRALFAADPIPKVRPTRNKTMTTQIVTDDDPAYRNTYSWHFFGDMNNEKFKEWYKTKTGTEFDLKDDWNNPIKLLSNFEFACFRYNIQFVAYYEFHSLIMYIDNQFEAIIECIEQKDTPFHAGAGRKAIVEKEQ
jgi:hypothetical protein